MFDTTFDGRYARALLASLLLILAAPLAAQTLGDLSHIHGIAVPKGEPDNLYLATHNGFFLASKDGTVRQLSTTTDDFMALVSDPADPDTLYASGHPRGGGNLGLLRSEDGGRNWTQISPGLKGPVDFHALTVSPADSRRIYGMYRGLQVSRDGGASWRMGRLPEGTLALAGSGTDPDRLYAATRSGLKLSKDGGDTWGPAMMMQLPASLVHVTADGHAYTFLVGRGLLKVQEPGLGWKPVFDGFGEAVPVQMASSVEDPRRLYVLDNAGHLWASTDAGASWVPFVEPS